MRKIKTKTILISSICILLVLIATILLAVFRKPILSVLYKDFKVTSPAITSTWSHTEKSIMTGDIYVSTTGNDSNLGTIESPFLSIDRALQEVASMDKSTYSQIVICIEGGLYNINHIDMQSIHGGNDNCEVIFCSYGEGDTILNAGIELSSNDFIQASNYPSLSNRLKDNIKDNIYVLDLKSAPYNLTSSDWGNIYPIGTYNTAGRYNGNNTGPMYSELFIDNQRQNLARFPNAGYIKTGQVIQSGRESANQSNGEPAFDIYKVDNTLASRIDTWQNLNDVWMYGFWQYDWADGSTTIHSFDSENNYLTTSYQSFFGAKEGADYFFYNCLEELDMAGEWFLDRENGLVCIYKPNNFENSFINLSISQSSVISINSNHITLKDITLMGSRGNGIEISGNYNKIENCKILDIGGHAVIVNGAHNLIRHNEVLNIGKSGISVTGGDRVNLVSGENIVTNNLIHDWSQVFKTYQAGINIGGVGNVCSYNELYNSPHHAITYDGNNNIFEYNLIHEVCTSTDDAGAIYAGQSWSSYGNHIRYNLIYNIGSEYHRPNGIYMDDAISGQNIYGNILLNIPNHAIFVGGGRDMAIYNNLIISAENGAIVYDNRARSGAMTETWFSDFVTENTGTLWRDLKTSPWKTELWQNAFPAYKNITDDFSKINDASFMANPANSVIENNIIFDKIHSICDIHEDVYTYSNIKDNNIYYLFRLNRFFNNHKSGDFTIKDSAKINDSIKAELNNALKYVGRY